MSLDGFAAGFSYGLKKVQLGLGSLAIVAGVSGLLLSSTLVLGNQLGLLVGCGLGQRLGGLLIIGLGLWGLWEVFSRRWDAQNQLIPGEWPVPIWQVKIKRLGVIIQILRDPQKADLDQSGNISAGEAVFLGVALGMDSTGVGLGLGFSGLAGWWFPLTVVVANLIFITLGQMLGRFSSQSFTYPQWVEYSPGLILILVGIFMLL